MSHKTEISKRDKISFNRRHTLSLFYYPFGMMMPGRNKTFEKFRMGFNGKENDDEVYGKGNFQDFGFRIYDTRIAKFISVDPLTPKYAMLAPYQFASNTPIQAIDLDGKEALVVTVSGGIFAFVGGEGGGGIAFTREGVSVIGVGTGKIGLGMGTGVGLNVSFSPTAKSINELKDWGFGAQISGGFFGKLGYSADYSSGNWGGMVSGGAGADHHAALFASNTTVIRTYSYEEVGVMLRANTPEGASLAALVGWTRDQGGDPGLTIFNWYKSKSTQIINNQIKDAQESLKGRYGNIQQSEAIINSYKSANFIQRLLGGEILSTAVLNKYKQEQGIKDDKKKIAELEKEKVEIDHTTYYKND